MDEKDLRQALDELGAETPVGSPPLPDMQRDADRVRRRRSWLAVGAAAAAVAVVGVSIGVLQPWGDPDRESRAETPAGIDPAPTGDADPVIDGERLLGIRHAAIEVPGGWGTNATRCGTPMKDTVIVDEGNICMALFARPAGVETIRIDQLAVVRDLVGEPVTQERIDGVEVTRWAPTCRRMFDDVRVCSAALWFHGDEMVKFTTEAATKKRAVQMLASARIVPDLVGLPGPNQSGDLLNEPREATAYLDGLRDLGLRVKIVDEFQPGLTPGTLTDIRPGAGTMLQEGDTVTVTRVGPQTSPAERVAVGVSWGRGGDDQSLTDAEVRAGGTVRLRVGQRLWSYAVGGPGGRRIEESMTGGALDVDHPNGPLTSYRAARPGTSTYTLSIAGETIGVVTIEVTA